MATIHSLMDLTKASIGTVLVGRGTSAEISEDDTIIENAGGTRIGPEGSDIVARMLKARIAGQDPLSVPAVLALTFPQTVVVGGRVVNGSTYEDATLLRCVLLNLAFNIVDQGAGDVTYELQNRAAEGNDIGDELSVASGTKQALPARKNTIRIRTLDSTFTPWGGSAVDLPGVSRLAHRLGYGQVNTDCSNPSADGNTNLCDIVDPMDLKGSGSIDLKDLTIASALDLPFTLAALGRGDLVLRCQLTGINDDATAPADKLITIASVKFYAPRTNRQSRRQATGSLTYNQFPVASDGTELTLAQLITMADAA